MDQYDGARDFLIHRHIDKPPYCACKGCNQRMEGIYSLTIRDKCESCGGKSLAGARDIPQRKENFTLSLRPPFNPAIPPAA